MKNSRYNIEFDIYGKKCLYNTLSDKAYFYDKEIDNSNRNTEELFRQNGFVVEDGVDEIGLACDKRIKVLSQKEVLNLMVFTTYNCNFRCSYCIQTHKTKASNLPDESIDSVALFIRKHYEKQPFKVLELSLFGGEPFMNYKAMERMLTEADTLSKELGFELKVHITTNCSIVSSKIIDLLKNYRICFQITIDGPQDVHDNSRFFANGRGSFERIIANLKRLYAELPKARFQLRTNFNNETIDRACELVEVYKDFDRNRTEIALNYIFQDFDTIKDPKPLYRVASIFNRMDFVVQCSMIQPNTCCFLTRDNSYALGFNGKSIFKCSSDPVRDVPYGILSKDGEIKKKDPTPFSKKYDLLSEKCRQCKLMPLCLGPCIKGLETYTEKCSIITSEADAIKFMFKQRNLKLCNTKKYTRTQ